MASPYIPFNEVLEYCTTDIPGEVFSNFSDQREDDILDHHESESDIYEENYIPKSVSNSMCFSVGLSQQQILPINFYFACYIHTFRYEHSNSVELSYNFLPADEDALCDRSPVCDRAAHRRNVRQNGGKIGRASCRERV